VTPSVAVVGAGLSGLTAGYRLRQRGWDATVLEAAVTAGGRVETVRHDGYIADTAASAVGRSYVAYGALADELGLRLLPATPYCGIVRDGTIHELRLDRPIRSALCGDLYSVGEKLRAVRLGIDLANVKLRRLIDYDDMGRAVSLDKETAGVYARRVLGAGLAAYLCDPIARGMVIANADDVSKVKLFSGLTNMLVQSWGALEGGQARMVEALVARTDVRLDSPVRCVREVDDGVEVTVGDSTELFDACVIACTLGAATEICVDHRDLLEPLNDVLSYTRTLSVAIGTSRRPRCQAFLIQFASAENPELAYMFLEHNKAADRAPAGHALFGACWESSAAERIWDAPDEVIIERTLNTLLGLFPELRGSVDYTHVRRWPIALAHTVVGGYARIGELNQRIDPRSRIQFASDFLSEGGQNTAVTVGARAAGNLCAQFGSHLTSTSDRRRHCPQPKEGSWRS
jgi:protoporphyrinogen/coproporphyrinogen III oxidase